MQFEIPQQPNQTDHRVHTVLRFLCDSCKESTGVCLLFLLQVTVPSKSCWTIICSCNTYNATLFCSTKILECKLTAVPNQLNAVLFLLYVPFDVYMAAIWLLLLLHRGTIRNAECNPWSYSLHTLIQMHKCSKCRESPPAATIITILGHVCWRYFLQQTWLHRTLRDGEATISGGEMVLGVRLRLGCLPTLTA